MLKWSVYVFQLKIADYNSSNQLASCNCSAVIQLEPTQDMLREVLQDFLEHLQNVQQFYCSFIYPIVLLPFRLEIAPV